MRCNMKKVSIIIPTYQRPELLKRALDSCVNQTYKNIEIIVIDDNKVNSDYAKKTKKIVDAYPQVKYIKNKTNLGGAETRNVGIKAASGEFIAFLDDDDEFMPDKIEKQMKRYQEVKDPKCCLIYNYIKVVGDKKARIEKRDCEGVVLYDCLLKNIAYMVSWYCPKKVLEEVNGFDNVKCCQEGILLLKLLEKGYTVYRVPEVLTIMYERSSENPSGVTNITEKYIENAKIYLNRCLELANQFDERKRKRIYQLKYYWIFNMYYVLKLKEGKKEYLNKILQLKMLNLVTFKTIFKYFIHN